MLGTSKELIYSRTKSPSIVRGFDITLELSRRYLEDQSDCFLLESIHRNR